MPTRNNPKKPEIGRIIKEEVIIREGCEEAVRNLGDRVEDAQEINQIKASATKKLRKEPKNHG